MSTELEVMSGQSIEIQQCSLRISWLARLDMFQQGKGCKKECFRQGSTSRLDKLGEAGSRRDNSFPLDKPCNLKPQKSSAFRLYKTNKKQARLANKSRQGNPEMTQVWGNIFLADMMNKRLS